MTKENLNRLNLELSAACNYECVGCPNTYMERKKGHMSLNLFKKIFSDIEGKVSKVYLWNYGEPLLNKNVNEMLEEVRSSSPIKILSSTGYPLERFKDLSFLTSLDQLIISINGFSEEVYNFHQKGGDFDTVLRGLELLLPYMENSNTEYTLQTVANSKNLNEINDKADAFARKYSFKKVIIKSFNVMDHKNETFSTYVPIEDEFNRYSKNNSNKKILKNEPCLNWMVINWNGDVNPCCWDYTGKYIFGNVVNSSVLEVWNSKLMQNHRSLINKKEYYPICIDCKTGKTIKEWSIK